MPNILKRIFQPNAEAYVFPAAEDLKVEEDVPPPEEDTPPPEPETPADGSAEDGSPADSAPEEEPKESPLDYAKVQAEALLEDARREVEELRQQAKRDLEDELELLRRTAREDGYHRGYTEGLAEANKEGKARLEEQAKEQIEAVQTFLEQATRERDQLLDDTREELKELALTIAEKVIRVSLKGSSDILRRMVERATDKRKRCEWAHIYIADCDVRGNVNAIPELTAALSHISDRVRVIPMADDESGTCIIEMPDEIMDASVTTQLNNIREVLSNAALD